MSTPTPAPQREYDQILSGDVTITKVSNGYKIKFSKKNHSKVLLYQIWSSTSAALNSGRKVIEVNPYSVLRTPGVILPFFKITRFINIMSFIAW